MMNEQDPSVYGLGFQMPRFRLFQSVQLRFVNEEGRLLIYKGVVIGVYLDIENWYPGWWYHVLWNNRDPLSRRYHVCNEPCSEVELEPLVNFRSE